MLAVLFLFVTLPTYSQTPYTQADLPQTKSIKNKADVFFKVDTIAFLMPFSDVESKGYGPSSDAEDSLLSIKSSRILSNITSDYLSPKLHLMEVISSQKDAFIINKEITGILVHFFSKKELKYFVSDSLNNILKQYGRKYVLIEDMEWLYNTKEFQSTEVNIHFTNFNREIRHYNVVGTESKFNFFIINVHTKELVYYKFDYWWRELSFKPDAVNLKSHFIDAMRFFNRGIAKKKST